MSTYFKTFVTIFLTAIICECVSAKCNTRGLKKFDANIEKLITVGTNRHFPENKGKDLKNYCSQSESLLHEVDVFKSRCMKGVSKQGASVLIYSSKNIIKKFCKKDSNDLTKLIAAAPCANQGKSELHNCHDNVINSLLGIQNEPDDKKKLIYICCEYYKILPCIEKSLVKLGSCSKTDVDRILDLVREIFGNVSDLVCSEFAEKSDICAKTGSPPRKRKNQRMTKSFAIPLLDILKSLPDSI